MKDSDEKNDIYLIPPNFIEGGTLFGGAFKLRNVVEALILIASFGIPILLLPLSITVRIILLCLTAFPAGLIALFGVSGECLSSYVFAFFKFLKNKRIIKKAENQPNKKKKA